MDRPYPGALAGAVGAALVAGLVLALADALVTARGAPGGVSALSVLPLTLGLYALPALAIGVLAGAVAGALRATFGAGAITALIETADPGSPATARRLPHPFGQRCTARELPTSH